MKLCHTLFAQFLYCSFLIRSNGTTINLKIYKNIINF
jgi:hypothetical protein